jgi:hypothetical protein
MFARCFQPEEGEGLVIADSCLPETLERLRSLNTPFVETQLGNAGSLRYAMEMAVKEEDETILYFAEDDYVYKTDSRRPIGKNYLREGLGIADYVTLYDHPDKYTKMYDGGEVSKVVKTAMTHWRYTQSTCMTFGTTVKTLREDMEVWLKYTDGSHPHDHEIFTELKERGRQLAVCIPGIACHTDLTVSGSMNKILIDNWAIETAISGLEVRLKAYPAAASFCAGLSGKTGWDRLVLLDAIRTQVEK